MTDFGIRGSDRMDNPAVLSGEVYKSQAYLTYLRLQAMKRSFLICEGNHRDLKALLEKLKKPEIFFELASMPRRQDMSAVLLDITRRLVNFLASTKMLLEHTDQMIQAWYSRTEFYGEYNRRYRSAFTENDLHAFVTGLRDYALHNDLPLASATVRVSRETIVQPLVEQWSIILNKQELLGSLIRPHTWSARAKHYLEAADEEISIETIVDEYFGLVQGFHSWMHSRLEEIHASELAWLQDMDRRIQKALELLSNDLGQST